MTSEIASVPINRDIFRTARERLAISRGELAQLVQTSLGAHRSREIDEGLVGEWEAGASFPSVSEAEAIADACVIDYLDLFRAALPDDPLMDFRGPPGGGAPRLSRPTRERLAIFQRLYELNRRLSSELETGEDVSIPTFEETTVETDVEAVGSRLREVLDVTNEVQRAWSDDKAALSEWAARTEALGVSVFAIGTDVADIRGASLWEQGSPPAILLNSSDTPTAQSFTLMHELSHLMTLRGSGGRLCNPYEQSTRRTEQIANGLAAETLVPAEWLRAEVGDAPTGLTYREWPQAERSRLRDTFNVSNQVLGIRLKDLGLATDSGYVQFWRLPGGQGRGRRLPRWLSFRRYMGGQTTAWLRRALAEDAMSAVEVARLLCLKAAEVERIAAA